MATPITVSVNFIDLTGNIVIGYMQAAVVSPSGVNDLYVTSTGIIAPKVTTSGTGSTVSVAVWGNDVIVDIADGLKDTYYTVTLFNTLNVPVWTADYLFTGAGPINLVGFPTLSVIPAPVGTVPTNILTGNNIFTGTNTFTNLTTFSGNVVVSNNLQLGTLTFSGSTSGSTSIRAAAVAGTPNLLLLPITTGAANAVLQTDGGNPQQLSWTTTPIFTGATVTGVGLSAGVVPVIITQTGTGPANVTTANLFLTDGVTPNVGAFFQVVGNTFRLRMDATILSTHGDLIFNSTGALLNGGGGSPSINLYTLTPTGGYVGITNQSAQIDLLGGGLLAVTSNPGVGDKGELLLDPRQGTLTFYGNVSGNAPIGVATAAGTPNKIQLPTATGAANAVLKTDGGSPQQTSWTTTPSFTSITLGGLTGVGTVASGTATLGTAAIPAGTAATVVTVSATGTATTDTIQADFNADPTATTGYLPGSMLTIVKYPTTNNVNFKVVNNTGASITPSAVTLNWRVVR